jgi:hypothetical protein
MCYAEVWDVRDHVGRSLQPRTFASEHVTLRQRYACVGDSLSVAVLAELLAYLLLGKQQWCPDEW